MLDKNYNIHRIVDMLIPSQISALHLLVSKIATVLPEVVYVLLFTKTTFTMFHIFVHCKAYVYQVPS